MMTLKSPDVTNRFHLSALQLQRPHPTRNLEITIPITHTTHHRSPPVVRHIPSDNPVDPYLSSLSISF